MDIISRFVSTAKDRSLSVVLPEGGDQRTVAAARRIKDEGIAEPIVLGTPQQIAAACEQAAVRLDGIRAIDCRESEDFEAYAQAYAQQRDLDVKVARRMVKRPLFYGGMMVARGNANTMVAGVATATATVIQAGALTVGYAPGIETASSFFLMVLPTFQGRQNWPMIFADCAVNVAPTPPQLADIALASYASAKRLLDEQARVAMLSYSTKGSAADEYVDKVTAALAIARKRAPDAVIDGEFQADSAIVPSVAAKKVRDPSPVAGQANVLIFPDLNSGNIAYKLTQYLAGARAIGPFLQGFSKPISDLSRGASTDDIVATTAVVLAMA